jgi:hypothetical protein
MATGQLSHPVTEFILMKTDNRTLHHAIALDLILPDLQQPERHISASGLFGR